MVSIKENKAQLRAAINSVTAVFINSGGAVVKEPFNIADELCGSVWRYTRLEHECGWERLDSWNVFEDGLC